MSEETKQPITVNGEAVADELIQQELQMLWERYAREMPPQEMEAKRDKISSDARENAVERILLMQQARKEISDVRSEEVDARFVALKEQHGGEEQFNKSFDLGPEDIEVIKADIADSVRLEKYFDRLCENTVRPGEAEARTYFDENPEEFKVSEQVHAAHIVQHPSPARPVEKVYAEMLNVRERLKGGEDFNQLASEYSHCGTGEHDLGYFARGEMVPVFEEVAFETETGGYSDVFQTEFGYHIVTVFDRRPESMREFNDVRYDIENMLFDARRNEVIGAMADKLRAEADIQNLEIEE